MSAIASSSAQILAFTPIISDAEALAKLPAADRFDVVIVSIARARIGDAGCVESLRVDEDAHDALRLWSVVSGRGTVTVRDGVYPCKAGDCFVLRCWEPFRCVPSPPAPLVVQQVVYRYRCCAGRPRESALPPLYRRLTDPWFFGKLFSSMLAAYLADRAMREDAEAIMSALLLVLDREDCHRLRIEQHLEDADLYNIIDNACYVMRLLSSQPVSIPELAESCGFSPSHFNRLFQRYTGESPYEYLMRARIEHAKILLITTGEYCRHLSGYAFPTPTISATSFVNRRECRQRYGNPTTACGVMHDTSLGTAVNYGVPWTSYWREAPIIAATLSAVEPRRDIHPDFYWPRATMATSHQLALELARPQWSEGVPYGKDPASYNGP